MCTANSTIENVAETEYLPCHNSVRATYSGFKQENQTSPESTMKCKSSYDRLNPLQKNCTVTIECKECSFEQLDTAYFEFSSFGLQAYARGFEYKISSTSGYQEQLSLSYGWLMSDPSKLFRGTSPTIVNMGAYQTTYRDYSTSRIRTGLHIDFLSFKVGDSVTAQSFARENGIAFQILFFKNSATLEVEKTEKKSAPNMLLQLMGSLAGLSNGSNLHFIANAS